MSRSRHRPSACAILLVATGLSAGAQEARPDPSANRIQDATKMPLSPYGRPTAGKPGPLIAVPQGGRWGYANLEGRVILAPRFERAFDPVEGLARARYEGTDLFIDESGRTAFVLEGLEASGDFSEGLAPVMTDGRAGFVDRNGTVVISPRFDLVYPFRSGVARVVREGQVGVINKTGEWVLRPADPGGETPVPFEDFSEGLAPFGTPERCGYLDTQGATRIPARYAMCKHFSEGLAAVQREDGKFAFIDPEGHEIFGGFHDALAFHEGLAPAARPDAGGVARWGYIDRTGAWVIEPRFEEARLFATGLAAVRVDGLFGYVAKNGRMAISPRYVAAGPFERGIARVGAKGPALTSIIDRKGKYIWNQP